MSLLNPRYREMLELQLGLFDNQWWTYGAIGQKYGVKRQRAYQIVEMARNRLRYLLSKDYPHHAKLIG